MNVTAQNIPEELKAEPRWVLWREEIRDGRPTKVPYSVRGGRASSIDPQTWSDFKSALIVLERSDQTPKPFNGLGFMFGGGWAGVEIDNCIDNESAEVLHPDAEAYIRRLNSYTETSPSGRGIHILVRHDGSLTGGRKASHPNPPITDIGAYCDDRYYTVTGAWWEGTPKTVNDATDELRKVLQELGKRYDVEEWVRKGDLGEPPVRLLGEDLRAWRGETFVSKPEGNIDRSKSLVRLALILRANRLPATQMTEVLRERDGALGWHKYDTRKDKGEDELSKIVDFVFQEREYGEPTLITGDGIFTYDFPNGIRIQLEYIQPSPRDGGLQAEITVTKDGIRIHWGRLVLASGSGRTELIKNLPEDERKQRPDFWKRALESACIQTTKVLRSVGEVVKATPQAWSGTRFLVYPVLPDRTVTVWFGDGGVGKGWLCLAIAVGVAWREEPRVEIERLDFRKHGNVLYIDAEDNQNTFEDRLLAVWSGFGLPLPPSETGIIYYNLQQTLDQDIGKIRQIIRDHNIVLVIVDSYAMAVGTEPESSEAASVTMKALRDLKTAALVVAHISKAKAEENGGAYKPYGSVIIPNSARSSWEIQRDSDVESERVDIMLYNRKTNIGRLMKPLGYSITFKDAGTEAGETVLESVTFLPRNMVVYKTDQEALLQAVDELQASGQEVTVSVLKEKLGKSDGHVRVILDRLEQAGEMERAGSKGRSHYAVWQRRQRAEV